ncbi:hypothetical protein QSU92_02475 [Microbacterium sp. ET2]|uniref:baeRF11 domain-containing protein n=1 Tax=Microbacterium albipurpureum TaxID=3050384 RepID=UPI00259CB09D|nr:hypothetical protein [Microbacterium sp. ET2 (Ac-2212)]WJL96095.1 hypothetical protein QSU92_02475 [Microbacterium sp. ET2 (Ac-2212)]
MLPTDIPHTAQLLELIDVRDDASVTIAVASSPVPSDHDRVRGDLRSAVSEAERMLAEKDVDAADAEEVVAALRALEDDDELWRHQSRSLVILASPSRVEVFRLANRVERNVAVGDRFDTGALLRATAFPHRAFIIQVSQGGARLTEISADHGVVAHELDLPDDHHAVLEHASNDGQADMPRPQGSTGDRIERERFCRVVQDRVVAIAPRDVPVILAATVDLDPAYRAVNTHPRLLEAKIDAHPDSLDDAELEQKARAILDAEFSRELSEWRELFGTRRAEDLATSRLAEVAAAATAAAVDELLFDIDATLEGQIDEFGVITTSEEPTPSAYAVVDEIAARVLRGGGTVRGVRNADLVDGSPVAALLRFPVSAPAEG